MRGEWDADDGGDLAADGEGDGCEQSDTDGDRTGESDDCGGRDANADCAAAGYGRDALYRHDWGERRDWAL